MLALLLSAQALAVDVDSFDPTVSALQGWGSPVVESPTFEPGLTLGLWSHFSDQASGTVDGVEHLQGLSPLVGWAPSRGVRLDAWLPVYGHVAAPSAEFGGPAFGDLRLQGLVPFAQQEPWLQAAFQPRIYLPTGNGDALVGRGVGAGGAFVVGGASQDGSGYAVHLGIDGGAPAVIGELGTGVQLDARVAGWWAVDPAWRVGLDLETNRSVVFGPAGVNRATTTRVYTSATLPEGLQLLLGLGTGITRGLGGPEAQVVAALSTTLRGADGDGDGVADRRDRCPQVAAASADGCAEDVDRDGLLDQVDTCPDAPEDRDGFQDDDGCPDDDNDGDGLNDSADGCPNASGSLSGLGCPDRDQDGVVDTSDACPDQPGSRSSEGCPDRDADRVPDHRDACPDQPAADPSGDGCLRLAWVEGDRLQLARPLRWSDPPSAEANALLDAVAGLLLTQPGLTQVEVGVHSDSSGNVSSTQRLATTLVEALVQRGVRRERLRARGYGADQPLDTNRTAEGRAANRRVEFRLLDVAPRPTPLTRPSEAAAPSVPAGTGTLTVVVEGGLWAEVYLDGQKLVKSAPFTDFAVPLGRHTLRVVNPRRGLDWTKEVEVLAGEPLQVAVPWSP